MSYPFYKVIHIISILCLFTGLVGLWGLAAAGGTVPRKWRMSMSILHGIGLLGLLVSGFGMLAKLGFMAHLPHWVYGKLAIWLVLGGTLALARRRASLGTLLLVGWIALGGLAAYLAIYKPF